jgi:voltage-gated potassium channel
MYLIEGADAGFTSIPRGVYWAVVTLTTVGYGDITPITPMGQSLAAFVMILGYGIIAVPTGIVTAELAQLPGSGSYQVSSCPGCEHIETDPEARFCRLCAARLSSNA